MTTRKKTTTGKPTVKKLELKRNQRRARLNSHRPLRIDSPEDWGGRHPGTKLHDPVWVRRCVSRSLTTHRGDLGARCLRGRRAPTLPNGEHTVVKGGGIIEDKCVLRKYKG